MKLETFKELLKLLRNNSERINAAYKLEIDLINFTDGYEKVITILLNSYYGATGTDWIDWFLHERDPERGLTAYDKDGNEICRTEEELWKLVEEDKLTKEDYILPTPMSNEQREQIIKDLFNK